MAWPGRAARVKKLYLIYIYTRIIARSPTKVIRKGSESPCENPPQQNGHGFSTEASLLICGSKAAGVPRGMALLVGGRRPRRGGRERSDRWKGASVACSLQSDAVGKFAGPRAHTPSLLDLGR